MTQNREQKRMIRFMIVSAIALMMLIFSRIPVRAEQEEKGFFAAEGGSVSVIEQNEDAGKFTVRIDPDTELPFSEVALSAWCAEDQSDKHVYTAEQKAGGAWYVTVNVSKHQNHLGIYQIRAYGVMENGKKLLLGEAEQYFSPANFAVISKTENLGERVVTLRNVNPWAETVSCAVWSKTGGQDDLIWNEAEKNEDGTWSLMLHTLDYLHDGKYRWKTLMGPSYGQYVTHVYSGVYFHSVAGYNMTSYNLDPNAYNMLGSAASHGCIRMCVRDAKWLYENVPSGTPIYIYDSDSPGPFGKPELPKIPPEQNWDPTDPEI